MAVSKMPRASRLNKVKVIITTGISGRSAGKLIIWPMKKPIRPGIISDHMGVATTIKPKPAF
jgi:hypothetical protein